MKIGMKDNDIGCLVLIAESESEKNLLIGLHDFIEGKIDSSLLDGLRDIAAGHTKRLEEVRRNLAASNSPPLHRAHILNEFNCIERDFDKFKVTALNGQAIFYVWRNEENKIACTCPGFLERIEEDSSFRCEHILAVTLYLRPQEAP